MYIYRYYDIYIHIYYDIYIYIWYVHIHIYDMYICIYIYVHMYMYVWWPPSRGPIFDISMRPNKKLIGHHGRYPGGFSSKPRVISSSDVTGMMLRRGIISGISQFNKYISAILRLVIIIQPDIHIYDYIWL